jgi:hypothetical protein
MTKRKLVFPLILLSYWLLIAGAYYLYLSLTAFNHGMTFAQYLNAQPMAALGILLSNVLLLQAACLYFIQRFSLSKKGLLGHFLFVIFFQQLLTANFIGAGLVFLTRRNLSSMVEQASWGKKSFTYGALAFILLLSFLFFVLAKSMI